MTDSSENRETNKSKTADVKLFIDLAVWYAEKRDMTVHQFLIWFTSCLSSIKSDDCKKMFPFFLEEQREAEVVLCDLLSRDFVKKQKVRTVGTRINRHTNWPRTYAKSSAQVPLEYYGVEIQKALDSSLLGGLAYVAQEWKEWLEKIVELIPEKESETANFKNRVEALKKAIEEARKRGVYLRALVFSPIQRQRILKYVKPEQKKSFLQRISLWNDYRIRNLKPVIEQVTVLIKKMQSEPDKNQTNLNNLFETTSHLSILKAATDAGNGWEFVPTKTDQISYHLKSGELCLKLGKGNPGKLFPMCKYSKNSDRMLQLRQLAGQRGSGYEPDIVMGFYHEGCEDAPHVVFGDAKRYIESDISGAYKSTIASTMVAYGHWGKLSIVPSADWGKAFITDVKPFFTLFVINSETGPEPEDSPVRTITLDQMTLKNKNSPELIAWFLSLSEQAKKVLMKQCEDVEKLRIATLGENV